MGSFRSLSARLTVQFALLFAAAMLIVSAALSTFIAGSASREVESQLQSSGAVYDRLWQQRSHELQNAAQLLARDFGFRAAVATGDEATMRSALGNAAAAPQGAQRLHRHRGRQGLGDRPGDRQPRSRGACGSRSTAAASPASRCLPAGRASSSRRRSWRRRCSAGWSSPPISTRAKCAALESLSAIPLHAAVSPEHDGRWLEASGSMSVLEQRRGLARREPCPRRRGVRDAGRGTRSRSRSPSRCRPSPGRTAQSCCSPIPRQKRSPTRASFSWRWPS